MDRSREVKSRKYQGVEVPRHFRNSKFGNVMLSRYFLDFSVGVGAFVIGLGHIPSLFSLHSKYGLNIRTYASPKLDMARCLGIGRSLLAYRNPCNCLMETPLSFNFRLKLT